jgi:hypothetical protein
MQRQFSERVKRTVALVALAIAVVAAVVVIGALQGKPHRTSYGDGYDWGYSNAGTVATPSCTHAEMASTRQVRDPKLGSTRPQGDGRPRDKFFRWQAGCKAGARAEVKAQ